MAETAQPMLTRRTAMALAALPLAWLIGESLIDPLAEAAAAGPGIDPLPSSDPFVRLSRVLTGRADINLVTARRIRDAFASLDPQVARQIESLPPLLRPGVDAEGLLQAAEGAGIGQAAYSLMAAWYIGTVGSGQKAQTLSYAEALMYQAVADGMYPPTYCLGGPNWWTAPVPPPGVGRPTSPAPTAPPTVGFPVPAPATR